MGTCAVTGQACFRLPVPAHNFLQIIVELQDEYALCGLVMDADVNAAINILHRGLAGGNIPAAALDAA